MMKQLMIIQSKCDFNSKNKNI